MKTVMIRLIRFSQKFISPRKGFHCAHAAHHEGMTCSNAVLEIINQSGPFGDYLDIQCREACVAIQELPNVSAQEALAT